MYLGFLIGNAHMVQKYMQEKTDAIIIKDIRISALQYYFLTQNSTYIYIYLVKRGLRQFSFSEETFITIDYILNVCDVNMFFV